MIEYALEGTNFVVKPPWPAAPVFPPNSIMLARTPFSLSSATWGDFLSACRSLPRQIWQAQYVFINATWDPIQVGNQEIVARRAELQSIFRGSKVVVLTAHAQHFYDNLPGVIYFPFFTMCDYGNIQAKTRRGRFGCLNRRPALHRIRLMYHALDQKLLDPSKDVYSISYVAQHDGTLYNLDSSGYEWMTNKLKTLPPQIATHPDGFPSDYTIDHPAWHTGISIITETEPGDRTIICEKTGKGILSRSCFTVYMADVGYRVLEDLGFAPRFFDQHAEYKNIEPLLQLMSTIETEEQALDYRQQRIQQIDHNFSWFGADCWEFWHRPWYAKYEPKLKLALANL